MRNYVLFSITAVLIYVLINRVQGFPLPHYLLALTFCLVDNNKAICSEVIPHYGFDLQLSDEVQQFFFFFTSFGLSVTELLKQFKIFDY